MISVADIQKDLPGWPKDIIEQWLLYFANESDGGWPPPEPLGNHRWSRLLGGCALSWWKKVTWAKEKVRCEQGNLAPKARADVAGIVAEMEAGTADALTKRRVAQAWIYIKDNATFPRPLVTMRIPGGLSLIDGSHRMAAFVMVQALTDADLAALGRKRPEIEQEVWVGTHEHGEVPNS